MLLTQMAGQTRYFQIIKLHYDKNTGKTLI